jgi:predicted lipid-binding transport protein (Tim44 family)
MKMTVIASMLAVGLMAGNSIAQTATDTTTPPQQQMRGNMMGGGMMGPGMMGGGMMGPGMMHGGMMGGQGGFRGMGCNGMMGGMMMNRMSPEMQQQFMDQTTDLRKQMMEKRFAYMEAMRNPKTTPQDLAKIEKEMLDLRTKMMDDMTAIQGK